MFKNPEKAVRVNHDSTISISTQIYTLNPSKTTFQFNVGLSEHGSLGLGHGHEPFWAFGFEYTPISRATSMLVTNVGD